VTLDAFLRQFGGGLSDELSIIGLGIVFLAGVVASAVCPCTVPVGLGVAGAAGATETESKRGGLAIAAAFFTGIVVNLTVLGMLAGRLGAFATAQFGRYWSLGMALMFLGVGEQWN
jgi:cytochrome c-type biogenesis protein